MSSSKKVRQQKEKLSDFARAYLGDFVPSTREDLKRYEEEAAKNREQKAERRATAPRRSRAVPVKTSRAHKLLITRGPKVPKLEDRKVIYDMVPDKGLEYGDLVSAVAERLGVSSGIAVKKIEPLLKKKLLLGGDDA